MDAEDEDASIHALLEWVNSVKGVTDRVERLGELTNGRILLTIMTEYDNTPGVGSDGATFFVVKLLEGLLDRFRRAASRVAERVTQELLGRVTSGDPHLDVEQMTSLVLWATLQDESKRDYFDLVEQLSAESMQAMVSIYQKYMENEGPLTPLGTSSPKGSLSGRHGGHKRIPAQSSVDDFLDVTLDIESRFHMLKERFVVLVEEKEDLAETFRSVQLQLDQERESKRHLEDAVRAAQEANRMWDLRGEQEADDGEARFEAKLERETHHLKMQLRQRSDELREARDELDLIRHQASSAQKLEKQLKDCRKRLDDLPRLKRENERLEAEMDARAASLGSATEHLRNQVDRLRAESAVLSTERTEAQRQAVLLRDELETLRKQAHRDRQDLGELRRERAQMLAAGHLSSPSRTGSYAQRAEEDAAFPGSDLAGADLGQSAPRPAPMDAPAEPSSEVFERLLQEREKATRAEEALKFQAEETAKLQRAREEDQARIAQLEAELKAGPAHESPSRKARENSDFLAVRQELESAQRELQIHRWRGRTERDALVAQETLMVSCFHELGLRYHQLKVEHENLRRKVSNKEAAPVSASRLRDSRRVTSEALRR